MRCDTTELSERTIESESFRTWPSLDQPEIGQPFTRFWLAGTESVL